MKIRQILSLYLVILGLGLSLYGCGPSKAEKERMERERQDSINRAVREAERLDSLRVDSIRKARKEARQKDISRDSTEIMALLPHFKVTKDPQFDSKRLFVYKGIQTSHFINNAYLSFATMQNNVEDLLLNVDVRGEWLKDKALLITHVEVIIGDDSYVISPAERPKSEYKAENSDIRGEWMYGEVSSHLMDKILEAPSIKINVMGSDGDKLLPVSSAELEKMKETIRLYKLMKEYGPDRISEFCSF